MNFFKAVGLMNRTGGEIFNLQIKLGDLRMFVVSIVLRRLGIGAMKTQAIAIIKISLM